jgi:hypothetical protein
MIGHYLLALTPAQEDRVLSMPLHRGPYLQADGCRCLRGAAEDFIGRDVQGRFRDRFAGRTSWNLAHETVGIRYDMLHFRFGERLNIAIRNRILSNRARRTLTPVFEAVAD